MTAPFDLAEQPLDHIGGADGFPVGFGKGVKGQTGLQISLKTSQCRGINGPILFPKSGQFLLGLGPTVLIKNGPEFRIDLIPLALGNVTQNVVQFVFDAPLPLTGGELGLNGVEHRLVTVTDP